MNILTIDLEDWFHILDHPETAEPSSWDSLENRIENNTERLLALLESKNQIATWFCLGWVAKKYPGLVRKIAERNEIACHSMNHTLLYTQNPSVAKRDILDNIHLLEDVTGKRINAYRSPGFSFTNATKWLINILEEAGIIYDCSIFPMKRNHGGYEKFPFAKPCRISYNGSLIREFPINKSLLLGKQIVFSGGGYFRLLPYYLVSSLMKKSDYVMTYFHPRDFDANQPMIETLSMKRKFMSYTGLKKSLTKLNRLLNEHKFISVNKAGEIIDWSATPLVNLEKY